MLAVIWLQPVPLADIEQMNLVTVTQEDELSRCVRIRLPTSDEKVVKMTNFYSDLLNINCEWIGIFVDYWAYWTSGFGLHENTLEVGLFLEKSVLNEKNSISLLPRYTTDTGTAKVCYWRVVRCDRKSQCDTHLWEEAEIADWGDGLVL
jgi:hypothetical protein